MVALSHQGLDDTLPCRVFDSHGRACHLHTDRRDARGGRRWSHRVDAGTGSRHGGSPARRTNVPTTGATRALRHVRAKAAGGRALCRDSARLHCPARPTRPASLSSASRVHRDHLDLRGLQASGDLQDHRARRAHRVREVLRDRLDHQGQRCRRSGSAASSSPAL